MVRERFTVSGGDRTVTVMKERWPFSARGAPRDRRDFLRILGGSQRQESTRDRQRRGLLGCRVCLKARGHQAIIRVRGLGIHVRIPRASLAFAGDGDHPVCVLSLIHISEPTRLGMISYAVFCLKKKKK